MYKYVLLVAEEKLEKITGLWFSVSLQAESTLSYCLIKILKMVLILGTSSIFKEHQDFEADVWEFT